jgi:alpha-L-rhamnosidase
MPAQTCLPPPCYSLQGVVRLTLPAPVPGGFNITVRHAELLTHPPYGPVDGSIYVGNLRSAQATDTYVTRATDSGVLILEPMFTFHGFRFVEITGLPVPPTTESVTGLFLRSALPLAGNVAFPSSAKYLNSVQV